MNMPKPFLQKLFLLVCLAPGLAAAAIMPSPALAAGGDLVPGFGTGGVVTIDRSGSDDRPYAAVISPTTLYITGYYTIPATREVEQLDLNTGSGGALVLSGRISTTPSDIRVDSTGTYLYLVNFFQDSDTWYKWRIEKRNAATGALAQVVISNPNTVSLSGPLSIAMDLTYMYVAGFAMSGGQYVWRIEKRRLDTGALETSFDGDGVMINTPSSWYQSPQDIAIDSTYMYVAGYDAVSGGNSQWRIEKRRLDTGALVTSFDSDGVIINNPTSFSDVANAIAIDSTYMYVVGYDAASVTSNYQWRIEKRRLDTGALDLTFDGDGVVTVDPSTPADAANAVAIDSTYMYVVGYDAVAGYYRWRIEKRRLDTGAPDTSFDGDGVVISDPGFTAVPSAIAIDATAMYVVGYDDTAPSWQWRIEKRELSSPPPPPPTVNLSAFPATINSGESSTLSWTSTDATSCDDVPLPEWISGPVGVAGSEVEWPTATTTYTISCTGPGGTTQQSATVTVTAPACGEGDVIWSQNLFFINSFVIDPAGNYLYLMGDSGSGYTIQKRGLNDGNVVWEQPFGFNATGNSTIYGNQIAVNTTGVYIAETDWDWVNLIWLWRVQKRSLDNGNIIWDKIGPGPLSIAYGIAIEPSFNSIYVIGRNYGGATDTECIEKRNLSDGEYDPFFGTGGIICDINIGDMPGNSKTHMTADSTGLYMATDTYDGSICRWLIQKRRLDSGNLIWEGKSNVASGYSNCFKGSIAVDSTGVYVVGEDWPGPGLGQWRIEKRDLSNGNLINSFGPNGNGVVLNNTGPSGGPDLAYDVVSDSTGIYISGATTDGSTGYWRIERRDSSNGNLIWSNTDILLGEAHLIDVDSTKFYVGSIYGRLQKRESSSGCGFTPPPTIDLFTATPSTINSGEPSTLDWSTTGASSCTGLSPAGWITEGGGGGACSGTTSPFTGGCQVVQPAATTDYIIECYNAVGDPAQQTVRVTVNAPPAGADCGLRMFDGTSTITLDCETPASSTSLRIYKDGVISGIKLVDPTDPNASRFRIQTGPAPADIKALRKQ